MAVMFSFESASAHDYLTAGQVADIGTGSSVIGLAGWKLYQRKSFDHSLIGGPLPGELSLMRFFGGEYYRGKTNFLDSHLGFAITPVGFGVLLITADLAWSENEARQHTVQDVFLYGSGLMATTGLTAMAKYFVNRPRPYTRLAESTFSAADHNDNYRNASFFSGHTSSAFFSATFLNLRLGSIMRSRLSAGEYDDWRWAPPTVLFGWATYVAWSRLHAYKHYPSDIAVGALVGYLMADIFYSWGQQSLNQATPAAPAPLLKIRFYL